MIGSLFSGVGGLELGLEHVTGLQPAWVCERDKDASVVLAERFGVPNLGDITGVRWEDVEPVDVICGGFPCQPFSSAGRRQGVSDDRWMWPEFARAVRVLRPQLVVVENVAALVADAGAFGRVLGDLAEVGYDARWTCLRASDVGAPHRRERMFLVADAEGERRRAGRGRSSLEGRPEYGRSPIESGGRSDALPADAASHQGWQFDGDGTPSADADSPRLEGWGDAVLRGGDAPASGPGWLLRPVLGSDVARADAWGAYEPAIRRWEAIHDPAPSPVDDRGRLSPSFVEWMMGFPPGWVTDVPISRSAQLRCLGNAVVPHAASAAWSLLNETARAA